MTSIFYFVIALLFMSMMSLPCILTVQGIQNYNRNLTATVFATGQWMTKNRVVNSNCMFNFDGACSLNIRVNTTDSATCSTLDINNTRVSLCCNTGKWCTVPGSRINLGTHDVTTNCSDISMDVKVLSLTCHGSSINCEDHQRKCTVQGIQNYNRNLTATIFATGQWVRKIRVGNSNCMFNFDGACSLNIRVNTTDSATCNTLDINNTGVNLCCNTGKWCTVPGSRINLGTHDVTTNCSDISMDVKVLSLTCHGSSINCEDHQRKCTDARNLTTTPRSTMRYTYMTPSHTIVQQTESPLRQLLITVNITTPSNSFNTALSTSIQNFTSFHSNHANATTIYDVHVTPTTKSIATSALMPSQTTWTSQQLTSGATSTERLETQSSSRAYSQTTVPASIYFDPGTRSQSGQTETNVYQGSLGFDIDPLTDTYWTTLVKINSTISSNLATKQIENNEPTLDTVLGTNITSATSGESPDVINTESAMISMYTFLAVFGGVLLAVFILVCVCFRRTKSPKVSQKKAANDLWPDKDLIERLHSSDVSPQTPYCINPVYQDYFDDRSKAQVPKQNSYGETICRVHPPTPTLPTHCCSSQSNWSLSPSQSKISNSSTPGDIYSFSYKKTDYYVDNISGDESDV